MLTRLKLTKSVGYENQFHDPCMRLEHGTEVVKADDVAALEADLADERWRHAACLSIAEGAPDWECVKQPSEAMGAVQRLRQRMVHAEQERDQLREIIVSYLSHKNIARLVSELNYAGVKCD